MMPFIGVMIIPTGIGAKIGGHAGDATVAAKLLAGVCDTLIVHPNVVNAADLNEMPANALYVEGSMLDRFLRGEIFLRPVRSNRILVVCNEQHNSTINCAAAARTLLGLDIRVAKIDHPLIMKSEIVDGIASGSAIGIDQLIWQLSGDHRFGDFDAVAIHTEIEVDRELADSYLINGGVNPWGGVEALVSRQISAELGVPVAHAPVETNAAFDEIVIPEVAAELISGSMLFSVLKGLHKAPRISTDPGPFDLSVDHVDALVSPMCWGVPHRACREADIPIIMVTENTTNCVIRDEIEAPGVRSYLEAAGALVAIREGIKVL